MALRDEIGSLMSDLAMTLTGEETGCDGSDEAELQEYGENSWYGEFDRQVEKVHHKVNIDAVQGFFKAYMTPEDVKKLNSILTEVSKELKIPMTMLAQEKMQNVLDKLGKKTKANASSEITVISHDTQFTVEIMDATHLKMKMEGTERWGIPLHFAQVDKEVIKQLKDQGLITDDNHHFVEAATETTLTRNDVIKAIKTLRGEAHPDTHDGILQLVNSLRLYKDRGEWDGSVDSAIKCLKRAEYEIKGDVKKKSVIAKLQKLGIPVKNGMVKKSDILAALTTASLSAERLEYLEETAKGSDFEGFASNPKLKEAFDDNAALFNEMTDKQISILLKGDFETGSAAHYFGNFADDVRDFLAEVGPILDWDPEVYLNPETHCMECQKNLEECECEQGEAEAKAEVSTSDVFTVVKDWQGEGVVRMISSTGALAKIFAGDIYRPSGVSAICHLRADWKNKNDEDLEVALSLLDGSNPDSPFKKTGPGDESMASAASEDEDFGIHVSDWNSQDKAFLFPEIRRKELMERLRNGYGNGIDRDTWDWFIKYAKPTKGVEDMDVFLDWQNPKECMDEWDEYFGEASGSAEGSTWDSQIKSITKKIRESDPKFKCTLIKDIDPGALFVKFVYKGRKFDGMDLEDSSEEKALEKLKAPMSELTKIQTIVDKKAEFIWDDIDGDFEL